MRLKLEAPNASRVAEGALEEGAFPSRALATLLLATVLAPLPGCSLLQAPQTVVNTVVPGSRISPPDPVALHVQLERFTDNFGAQMAQAPDDYAQKVVNHGFRLALVLIGVLLTDAVLAGLVYRFLAEKLNRHGNSASVPAR